MIWLLALLAGAVLLWGGGVALLLKRERALIFPAPAIDRATLNDWARQQGASERTVVGRSGVPLYGWRAGQGDRLVLMFSGNGSSVGATPQRQQRFVDAGFEVLHVNYRGYPGSAGSPSEAGLLEDARAAWDEARRTHAPEHILVHGKSLGGGVAIGLLAGLPPSEQPALLVVESSFASIAELVSRQVPVLPTALLESPFRSLARCPQVRPPALVLHGDKDAIIPADHGRRLAEALPQGQLQLVPGAGHNDDLLADPQAWAIFQEFTRDKP